MIQDQPLADRVSLVTGATSGIGKATAVALASMGSRVGLVARDAAKGERTLAEIRASSHNDRLDLFEADLSSQASVRALSEDVRRRFSSLNVLVNCAGDSYAHRHATVDGLELAFALNHLAYFQLTMLLLDLLVRGATSRIVNVTSGAQSVGRIHSMTSRASGAIGGRLSTTSRSAPTCCSPTSSPGGSMEAA